jgi:nicotinamidase-related amidase
MTFAPVGTAVPYPWPWHGRPDGTKLALIILAGTRWRRDDAAVRHAEVALALLGDAVRACGGIVVVATDGDGLTVLEPDATVETHGLSALHGTALDDLLRSKGRTDLLLAGFGLEGPVHSTMREANDRGYECLLVPDACIPADPALVAAACSMVMHSGGIFGAYAPVADVLAALGHPAVEDADPPPAETTTHPFDKERTAMNDPMPGQVDADPYPWPYDGVLEPEHTALICIDWQVDFCGPGGYVDRMGYDLSLTRNGLEPTARVLTELR